MKLKSKIHLSSTLLMLVILVILMVIIYFSFSRLAFSTEVQQLQTETEALLATFTSNETGNPDTVLRAYVPIGGLVKIVGATGDVLSSAQAASITADFPDDMEENSGTAKIEGGQFAYVKSPIIWTDGEVATLLMAKSMEEVTGNLATLRYIMLITILLAMIPVVISSMVLGRIVTQPIDNLTKTMTRIRRNGQFEKLPISGKSQDELTRMGITFNEMMSLLEENFSKQEEFVSNASHELKTPLTVIGSYARLMQRRGMDDEKVAEEALTAIQAETERMKSLIEQLLHIARSSDNRLEWTKANIVEILEQTTAAMGQSYGRDFRLVADERVIEEKTDVARLKQLLYILLDNARKYSEERIEVTAEKNGSTVIQIRDYGIGIPKQSLPHVFDRFYRVDQARNRETGGSGLGLSLAKQLAESLGIVLEIESIENMGTTVSLTFSSDFNVAELQSDQEGS